MTSPVTALDHIVVAADTLEQGTAYVHERLGMAPAGGGMHAAMGTHNRVLKLGRDQYLEVIAIDPEGRRPEFPRWFNLDDPVLQARLKIRPRLITWVARTDAIDSLTEKIHGQRGAVRPMQRDALRWRFAFTADGSMSGDGLIPHLIQWTQDSHPARAMVDSGCVLVSLNGIHSDPAAIQQVITSVGLEHTIAIHPASNSRPAGLSARIQTSAGLVTLD